MNDVLAKPIDSQQLNYVILNLTSLKKSNGQSDKEIGEPAEATTYVTGQELINQPSVELEIAQSVSLELEDESALNDELSLESNTSEEVIESIQPEIEDGEFDVFNPDTLNTLKGHLSAQDLEVMINDVIVKSEEIITDIQKALMVEDVKLLSSKGHELKGMAGNFGLVQLSTIASDIESKAKAEQPPIVISSLVERLPNALKNSKQASEEWIKDNA